MKILDRIQKKYSPTESEEIAAEIREYIKRLKEINDILNERDEQIHSIQWDYKKIFNLISDAIILLDDEGLIIDLNRKSQVELKKYNVHSQLIGYSWKSIVDKMGGNWDASIEKEVIESDDPQEKSKEIYVGDVDKHFLLSITPVKKSVYPSYFIIIIRDITSIKREEIN